MTRLDWCVFLFHIFVFISIFLIFYIFKYSMLVTILLSLHYERILLPRKPRLLLY